MITHSHVILFSGGMDSVALRYFYPNAALLYLDMGTGYSRQEMQRLPPQTIVESFPLAKWEREDKIIPMRNLLLVTLASLYGDTILIGATAGDRVLDKSRLFLSLSSVMLSYLWQPQHWTGGREISVQAPFKGLTKTQIIKQCKERGVAENVLYESFSCYDPVDEKECGMCKPCFRKWVAAEANGIRLPFANFAAAYGRTIRDEIISRGGDEYADTRLAYSNIGESFE